MQIGRTFSKNAFTNLIEIYQTSGITSRSIPKMKKVCKIELIIIVDAKEATKRSSKLERKLPGFFIF